MFLEVVLEEDSRCQRCAKLVHALRKMCDDLNIPFIEKYLENRAVAAFEEPSVTRTFSREWIEKWGLPEHKKSLKKIEKVLAFLQERKAGSYPCVIIRWHDGIRLKEIVIRGFEPDSKEADAYLANLYVLLKMLKKVVYRR